MHDAQLVRGLERVAELGAQLQRFGLVERAPREPVGQRLPAHELHDEELGALVRVEVQHGGDPGMVEARVSTLEHARRQNFQRDIPLEPFVPGAIDDAHSALAQALDDPVARQRAADERGIHVSVSRVPRQSTTGVAASLVTYSPGSLWYRAPARIVSR